MSDIRRFVFNAMLVENSLDQLSSEGIGIRGETTDGTVIRVDEIGFSPRIVHESQKMASVFMAFFCLENSVRDLITERLLARQGTEWWKNAVPQRVQQAVEKLQEKEEKHRYHAQRASELIGYTMFGNLGQIIIANWNEFSDLFPDQAWVSARFNDLEMSRNIIMHTGVLPQIEIERIQSIVRDWVRQVG